MVLDEDFGNRNVLTLGFCFSCFFLEGAWAPMRISPAEGKNMGKELHVSLPKHLPATALSRKMG